MPDDPQPVPEAFDAVGAGRVGAAELCTAPGPVLNIPLRDADLVDALAVAQRDVPVRAAEVAVERKGDVLGDDDASVARDLDDDVRPRKRERLGGGVSGERERRDERGR